MKLLYCTRHMWRNFVKSLLLVGISALAVSLITSYLVILSQYNKDLLQLYESIPVEASIISREHSVDKLQIPTNIVEGLLQTGFVGKSYLEMQELLYYIDPFRGMSADLSHRDNLYATSDIEEFTPARNGLLAITYAPGVSPKVFAGDELLCIVEEGLLERFSLDYGSDIYLSGSFDFVDIDRVKGIKFKIVGSYALQKTDLYYGFDDGDIIVPLNALIKNYNAYSDKVISSKKDNFYYSQARLTLTNKDRLHEFKTYLNATDFGKPKDKVSNPIMARLAFALYDGDFNDTILPVKKTLSLLNRLFPLFLVALNAVGISLPLLLHSARKKELAVLRTLGTKRIAVVQMTTLENTLLSLTGALTGLVFVYLLYSGAFEPAMKKAALYLVLYIMLSQIPLTIFAYVTSSDRLLHQLSAKE